MSDGYAGDLSPTDAWSLLAENPSAVLVDVRTLPEWSFVGLPDLANLSKEPMRISWQVFPSMQVNPQFVEELGNVSRDAPVLLLCRSGARSQAAAKALTQAGFMRAYNIADGFEGPHDGEKHRGRVSGWKAVGLPWVQN